MQELLSTWCGSGEVQDTSKAASVQKTEEMPEKHIRNIDVFKNLEKKNIFVCLHTHRFYLKTV